VRISVNEPNPRPQADATAEARKARRGKIAEKRKIRDEMHSEVPRYVRAGRIQVQLRPSPTLLRECAACGHENWKWLDDCSKCGEALA
jgi:hypothetical protein